MLASYMAHAPYQCNIDVTPRIGLLRDFRRKTETGARMISLTFFVKFWVGWQEAFKSMGKYKLLVNYM